MEQLPLDFSQPVNRLTSIAEIERDAVGDGDAIGRGTGTFLDVYNEAAGTSVDVFERKMNIKFNAYQPNKPYQVEGEV